MPRKRKNACKLQRVASLEAKARAHRAEEAEYYARQLHKGLQSDRTWRRAVMDEQYYQTQRLLAMQRLECRRFGMQRCTCNVLYVADEGSDSCVWCNAGGSPKTYRLQGRPMASTSKSPARPARPLIERTSEEHVSLQSIRRKYLYIDRLLSAQQTQCAAAGMRRCACLLLYKSTRWHSCVRCRAKRP